MHIRLSIFFKECPAKLYLCVALSENSDLSYVFPSAKCEQNSNAQVVVANKQALCLNELTDLYEILHAVQGNVTLQGDVLKNLL